MIVDTQEKRLLKPSRAGTVVPILSQINFKLLYFIFLFYIAYLYEVFFAAWKPQLCGMVE